MDRIMGIFFTPPMAIARLGSSDTPMEAFDWVEDKSAAGGNATIVNPALTFEVLTDGSLRPYLPEQIRFKDDGKIRPVAPFFELWVKMQSSESGERYERPLTHEILKLHGADLANIHFRVIASNRKAQSRTHAAQTSFTARLEIAGDDHKRKPLLAISPHSADQQPLVLADHPIPLGHIQVIRPTASESGAEVDLNIVRVRFTPAKGQVYGPPDAIAGPASPLQPGDAAPSASLNGRIHQIVPEQNRILNPESEWSKFEMDDPSYQPDSPIDAYDGANVGTNRSWGVVDDTCDLQIEAGLTIYGERFQTQARAFVGPPAYSPDRRPFYAATDEFADRELGPVPVSTQTLEETTEEIVDLFNRIFETATTVNLDAHRSWALTVNASKVGASTPNNPGWDKNTSPKIGPASMSSSDTPYVDVTPDLAPGQPESMFNSWDKVDRLPYKQVVDFVHAPLMERQVLLSFLKRRAQHVRTLIRKPLGTVKDLPARPGIDAEPELRDPREIRERLYDMKMPPYMRHNMGYPLTLSIRQYRQLMAFIDLLESQAQEHI